MPLVVPAAKQQTLDAYPFPVPALPRSYEDAFGGPGALLCPFDKLGVTPGS